MIHSERIDHHTGKRIFQHVPSHSIPYANWGEVNNVEAVFFIGNDNTNIYLRYDISEMNVLGRYIKINDPVFKDSCVEFFISFDNEQYYNFEFNCIGNVLAQYGANRKNRTYLNEDTLQKLSTDPSLGNNKIRIINRNIRWTLDIIIPIEVFQYTQINNLTDLTVTSNFFKCGDDLPEPHYLSWSPVNSPVPDFHRPDSFKQLKFT